MNVSTIKCFVSHCLRTLITSVTSGLENNCNVSSLSEIKIMVRSFSNFYGTTTLEYRLVRSVILHNDNVIEIVSMNTKEEKEIDTLVNVN